MKNRGSPVNRIPIMAKDVLDLFRLYQLVVEKGGLVEVGETLVRSKCGRGAVETSLAGNNLSRTLKWKALD